MNKIVLKPNAKINIGLYVTEKRTDGFHNLETLFYPVDLCDELVICTKLDSYGECEFTQNGFMLDCADEHNLVVKAYRLLCDEFNLPSVNVCLTKSIPFGAGLGGGSADAAFMLKGLNELFSLHLSDDRLERYAATLGSDCAFFIKNKPVFACGRGEEFTCVELSLNGWHIVMVKPAHGVSTADAFGGIIPHVANVNLREICDMPITQWQGVIENAFEQTVFVKYPDLLHIKNKLIELGAVYTSMSGSGSTVFGLFKEVPHNIGNSFPDMFVWHGVLE
ncbi:MAG: 4-(cytidine 5'-diphospho)-2-C-methyl-D-erythritol kinase [Marinifilaceae bacterium]